MLVESDSLYNDCDGNWYPATAFRTYRAVVDKGISLHAVSRWAQFTVETALTKAEQTTTLKVNSTVILKGILDMLNLLYSSA